jgi:hypothetical protein
MCREKSNPTASHPFPEPSNFSTVKKSREWPWWRGTALSHRIPLAKLKCWSDERRKELAASLGSRPDASHGAFHCL